MRRHYYSLGIGVVIAVAVLAIVAMVVVLSAPSQEDAALLGGEGRGSAATGNERGERDAEDRGTSKRAPIADGGSTVEEAPSSSAAAMPGAEELDSHAATSDGEAEFALAPGRMSPRLAHAAWMRTERDASLTPRQRQQVRGELLQAQRLPYRFVREFELQASGTHLERATLIPLRGLQRAITHSDDGRIALWDVRSGAATVLEDPNGEPLGYVTHDETGSVIVAETPYREWQIWETTPPRLLHTLPALNENRASRAVRGGWFLAIVPAEEEGKHELAAWRLSTFARVEWEAPVVFKEQPRAVHLCTTANEAIVWTDERLERFALATGEPTGTIALPRWVQQTTGNRLEPLDGQRWLARGNRVALVDLAKESASELDRGELRYWVGYNARVRFVAESREEPLSGTRLELHDSLRDRVVREVVIEPPDELAEATLADVSFIREPAADANVMQTLWLTSGQTTYELDLSTGRITALPIDRRELPRAELLAFLPEGGLATVSTLGDVATWNARGYLDTSTLYASLPPRPQARILFSSPEYRNHMISLLPDGSLRVKLNKWRLADFNLPDLSHERIIDQIPLATLAGGLLLERSLEDPITAPSQRFLAVDADGDVHAAIAASDIDEGSDMPASRLNCLSLSREVVLLEFRDHDEHWAVTKFTLLAWNTRTHEVIAAMTELNRFSAIQSVDLVSNDGRYWISNSSPDRAGEVDEAEPAEPAIDWEAWTKTNLPYEFDHTVVWDAVERRVQSLIPFPTCWSSSALLADDRVLVRTTGIDLEAWDIHTGRLLAYEPFALRDAVIVGDPYDSQRVAVLPHADYLLRERGAPTVYRIVPQ